jgi:hypothetical protein
LPAPEGTDIPESILSFLSRSMDSVEGLEILFLLYAAREREWTADEITAELRSSVLAVQDRLDGLERSGLIRRAEGGKCRFDESSPDAALVPELHALFAKRPFTIMNLILKNPTDKIRTFADAFRLKREKDKE